MTEDQYQRLLGRAEELWGAKDGTPEGDELEEVLDAIEEEEYELEEALARATLLLGALKYWL